jgi:hypothetical protein
MNPFCQTPTKPSRFITESDFAGLYAAAEFAAFWGLTLDVHIAITWRLISPEQEADVQAALTGFFKCLRAWLDERRLPQAWIYSHETGRRQGAHTHLAIHIPGKDVRPGLRKVFRQWLRDWAKRQAGGPAARAVRVRDDGGRTSETLHWLFMSYLAKGFDREAVVLSARNAPCGVDVMLGDLIAFPWHDPGPVLTKARVGWSRSLGPDRRAVGYPSGKEGCVAPARADVAVMAQESGQPFKKHTWWRPNTDWGDVNMPRLENPKAMARYRALKANRPFRSSYEDGARDVRLLYPATFVGLVLYGHVGADAGAEEVRRQLAERQAQDAVDLEIQAQLRSLDI